ncbi:M20 family metallopeptidase [Candidatus Puniceispirillum sp.]|nr:M20 family metallopeptidase [Candidatus Puniceispirillum sp.]
MAVINSIADRTQEMKGWRHLLHQHPESSYEEVWTSDFIAEKLRSFGIELHRGMGRTGIVGVLRGTGSGTAAIGLRADMDALPMQEMNEFAHASKTPGRMHACGHDGHSTMLLGAAQYLAETRNFDGTVYFIFQPAEEGGNGGEAMIKDGLFDQFNMSTVWGMHNWPGMDVGKIGVHNGACMAAADFFEIHITGSGGHAAMPDLAIDPIPCGAAIVQSLQSIVSRRITALEAAVISVTIFDAGSALNVIPGSARLGGTARSFSPKIRKLLEDSIYEIAQSTAKAYDCAVEIDWQLGYPPTVNHANESVRAVAVASDILGHENVITNLPPSMGAEDFSFMLSKKPGSYIWLGAGPAKEGAMLHNDRYDFNDSVLATGASYWARLVESELPNKTGG